MLKIRHFTAAVLFLILIFACAFAQNPSPVQNPSFELCEDEQPPAGWYSESGNAKYTDFSLSYAAYNGEKSAYLSNSVPTYSRITQFINCTPGVKYRLTVMARTEGVHSAQNAYGAYITVQSRSAYGQNKVCSMMLDDECPSWTPLTLYFTTTNIQQVCIWLCLGADGAENSGSVCFDCVEVEEVEAVPDDEPFVILSEKSAPILGYLPFLAAIIITGIAIWLIAGKSRGKNKQTGSKKDNKFVPTDADTAPLGHASSKEADINEKQRDSDDDI